MEFSWGKQPAAAVACPQKNSLGECGPLLVLDYLALQKAKAVTGALGDPHTGWPSSPLWTRVLSCISQSEEVKSKNVDSLERVHELYFMLLDAPCTWR